jgi:hypothetical protein
VAVVVLAVTVVSVVVLEVQLLQTAGQRTSMFSA